MAKNIRLLSFILLISSTSIFGKTIINDPVKPTPLEFEKYSENLYEQLNTKDLNYKVFKLALRGYLNLEVKNEIRNHRYLTIIDMSLSSNSQRFFIVDMRDNKIAHQSVVAHGKNSGLEFAKFFSNQISSYKSSLGFYKTAETYYGKHGLSMRLDGLEFSNNNARKRAIVLHNADYVSENYIHKNHRVGRSLGCPSIPKKGYKEVIQKIKEGSVLFIYYPNKEYLNKSELANKEVNDLFMDQSFTEKRN